MNPRNRTKAKVSADEGMAMILVLSIAVVLMLLGLASITMANGALNSSSGHVSFERTIHLAEEGIDQTMARLQKDRSYSTVATVPTFATVAEEEAWARAQLAAVPEADLKQTNRGQVAVVKPAVREGSGVEAKVVYAAAWTPSRANATRERVVKTE